MTTRRRLSLRLALYGLAFRTLRHPAVRAPATGRPAPGRTAPIPQPLRAPRQEA